MFQLKGYFNRVETARAGQRILLLLMINLAAMLLAAAWLGLTMRPEGSVAQAATAQPAENGQMAFSKQASSPLVLWGETVTYTFRITNTGSFSWTELFIEDDHLGDIFEPLLEPVQPGDGLLMMETTVLTVSVMNIATAYATTIHGDLITATDYAYVEVISPSLDFTKEVYPPLILPGHTVTYTFGVFNSGDVTLQNITIEDEQLDWSYTIDSLEPGEEEEVSTSTELTETTTNEAIATAEHDLGVITRTAEATVDVISPSLDFTKEVYPPLILPGHTVTYTFGVFNSGDVTLQNITIEDEQLDWSYTIDSLEPGEEEEVSTSTELTETTTNEAIATAEHDLGVITRTAEATVDVISPAIELEKTAAPTFIYAGQPVTYTYRVFNSGDYDLTDVTVVDDELGLVGQIALLPPEEEAVFDQVAFPQASVTNVATATGHHPLGEVSATDSAFVEVHYRAYLPVITKPPAWQQVGDRPDDVTRFYNVAVCGDHYLAGTDQGLYLLDAAGQTWTHQAPVTGFTQYVAFTGSDCNQAYATVFGGGTWMGIYDDGWSWTRVNSSGPGDANVETVLVRGNTVFIGGMFGLRYALIPAAPDQHNWQSSDLTGWVFGLTRHQESDVIVAAVWNDGVYTNAPGNNNLWERQGALPDQRVYQAASGPDGAPVLAGTQSRLYQWSANNWQPAASAYTNTTFAVAVTGNRLLAGQRDAGVIVSQDGGQTWRTMNDGLVMPPGEEFQVRGFFVSSDGDYLYVATTSGVWRWPLP